MLEDNSSSDEEISALLLSDPCYRKYAALKRRCQAVDQENQRLVGRVYHVQRQVRLARRQCRLVAARLEQHGDDYCVAAQRAADAELDVWDDGGAPGRRAAAAETVPKSRLKSEKKSKRRLNEPKRPSNPFFQYCQEQRGHMLSQMKGQSPAGVTKAGVTKQLAANWSRMSAQHKQKYVERYEEDKRQYAIAMQKLQSGGTQGTSGPS
ncbi:high mobility group B protein 1-like [Amphibalanus amphitrite]|uniref:high mobility group B protein 1-like n=1 Tax=Amphibalanus amphitrite TaxID=1232801 RepID=UPI001C916A8D|nr:high mobility group B protein 1-like [Amphibalanus amphitrite]